MSGDATGQWDNTGRGALFANQRKTDPADTKKPDYTGKLNIAGVEYWLSGWLRTPKQGGRKYLSLKLGDACEQQPGGAAPPPPAAKKDLRNQPAPSDPLADAPAVFKEDDIPF